MISVDISGEDDGNESDDDGKRCVGLEISGFAGSVAPPPPHPAPRVRRKVIQR